METTTTTGTLAERLRQPSERRLRAVLLFLLTFNAGCVDMLSYFGLGRAFASFMTGNILFIGLGVAKEDFDLLIRASVALLAFILGAVLGTLLVRRVPRHPDRHVWLGGVVRYLYLEWFILLAFAIAWHFTSDVAPKLPTHVALLGVAALAMGSQGALVSALKIPGVVSDALTGTVLELSNRLAERVEKQEPSNPLSTRLLIALCFAYVSAALLIALAMAQPGLPFLPVIIVTILIGILQAARVSSRRAALRRGGPAPSPQGFSQAPIHRCADGPEPARGA